MFFLKITFFLTMSQRLFNDQSNPQTMRNSQINEEKDQEPKIAILFMSSNLLYNDLLALHYLKKSIVFCLIVFH